MTVALTDAANEDLRDRPVGSGTGGDVDVRGNAVEIGDTDYRPVVELLPRDRCNGQWRGLRTLLAKLRRDDHLLELVSGGHLIGCGGDSRLSAQQTADANAPCHGGEAGAFLCDTKKFPDYLTQRLHAGARAHFVYHGRFLWALCLKYCRTRAESTVPLGRWCRKT